MQNSYVYVFDGLPRFLSDGVMHSDQNLIGVFCGTTRNQPITVEATSGNRFCYIFIPLSCMEVLFLSWKILIIIPTKNIIISISSQV